MVNLLVFKKRTTDTENFLNSQDGIHNLRTRLSLKLKKLIVKKELNNQQEFIGISKNLMKFQHIENRFLELIIHKYQAILVKKVKVILGKDAYTDSENAFLQEYEEFSQKQKEFIDLKILEDLPEFQNYVKNNVGNVQQFISEIDDKISKHIKTLDLIPGNAIVLQDINNAEQEKAQYIRIMAFANELAYLKNLLTILKSKPHFIKLSDFQISENFITIDADILAERQIQEQIDIGKNIKDLEQQDRDFVRNNHEIIKPGVFAPIKDIGRFIIGSLSRKQYFEHNIKQFAIRVLVAGITFGIINFCVGGLFKNNNFKNLLLGLFGNFIGGYFAVPIEKGYYAPEFGKSQGCIDEANVTINQNKSGILYNVFGFRELVFDNKIELNFKQK
ncbi:MAG: hypothetical protein J0G32_03140 [Alphaproteobacteria bacterium]|nr:hypothetical protein [Alphaproteobacteria bacterium]OJV16324.1 MAG: hypothetical protein BGO27_03650 [Alphaproteobacteria bacterium 33-17]